MLKTIKYLGINFEGAKTKTRPEQMEAHYNKENLSLLKNVRPPQINI